MSRFLRSSLVLTVATLSFAAFGYAQGDSLYPFVAGPFTR